MRLALQIALLAGAAVFVIDRMGNLQGVGELMSKVRWRWVFVSVAAQALAIWALAGAQHLLLRASGSPSRMGRMTGVTLASNAMARSVPAGVVVAEGYSFRQFRRMGADNTEAAWTELATGALSVATLAGLALAGLALRGGTAGMALLGVVAVVFVGASVTAGLFGRPVLLSKVLGRLVRLARRLLPEGLERPLRAAEASVRGMAHVRPGLRPWLTATTLTGLNWVGDAVCLAAAVCAVGGRAGWPVLIIAFAAAQLLASLPFTVGGLGFVEGGLVVVLTTFGVGATVAGAGALAYRAVSFGLLVLVGWAAFGALAYLDRRHPRPA